MKLPDDVDCSKLTIDEQLLLSWFLSPKGYHTIMVSDGAHDRYQELVAKARSINVPSNQRGFADD